MAATTAVRNTAAGYTAPLQWTSTAGGTALEWYTPALNAGTLSGVAVCSIRAFESNAAANATVRVEIASVNGDGTNATVWGASDANAELATSEGTVAAYVSGADLSITAGQRIRVRAYLDDFEAAMGNTYTGSLVYGGAANATGDSYFTLPVTFTEYTAPAAGGDWVVGIPIR